jgi:peptidyl-tRNA hydrolase, PTH1 family
LFALIGLGNPGARYANTRHNAGFWVVEFAAELVGRPVFQTKFDCAFARVNWASEDALIIMPQRYMNRSGEAAAPLLRYFRIEPEAVIVAHDDLDLEPGVLRIKRGGSAGGHHGVEDLARAMGTEDFFRLRIGIGRPPVEDVTSWVLSAPFPEDVPSIREACEQAARSIETLVRRGLEAAQSGFSRSPKKSEKPASSGEKA